jgi:hypothetical protein
VFCWLLMALILDNGKGKLKDLCGYLPPRLKRSYWIPGSWHLSMVYTDAIPFHDP